MKDKNRCISYGYVYDPEKGEPETDKEQGKSFEDLDNQWIQPRCKAGKNKFQKYI